VQEDRRHGERVRGSGQPACLGYGGRRSAASLQWIATLPHNPPGLYPVEPVLEFDQSEHPIRMAVLQEPIVQRGRLGRDPDGRG